MRRQHLHSCGADSAAGRARRRVRGHELQRTGCGRATNGVVRYADRVALGLEGQALFDLQHGAGDAQRTARGRRSVVSVSV